jgi:DNA-binding IclR family transcriptional regulator
VDKVFSILQVLARSQSGMTMRDLARLCFLPKSSVHGIIVTLERRGYLHRSERTGRYLFDKKLLLLGNHALRGMELRDRVEPYMRMLAQRARLPVHVGISEANEAVIIARVDTMLTPRVSGACVGRRRPLHCTAMGKALLADWSDLKLERMVEERPLVRHNENTIASLKRLRDELDQVRRQGYAVDDEEDVLGFRGVGAPLVDGQSEVVGAICISGTTGEITGDNLFGLASLVKAVARLYARQRVHSEAAALMPAAIANTLSGVISSIEPVTPKAAITLFCGSKIGAPTERTPSASSSSSVE